MSLVSVFMDVEDPINPLADDAALDFAQIFTEAGIRGSFCLTGEKCRTLLARGRQDVIDAYGPHCLGLHTDTHSAHPTTMELLADLPFDEGCEAAYAAEKKGFDAFTEAFAKPPAFWGGAGNTWSPEITEALKRLGIPAYSYALTESPDLQIHRFNGVIALPQHFSIPESVWASDDAVAELTMDQPWIGIFVGHPTRFRYAEFWDKPYALGRTPAQPEYAEAVPDEVYERSKAKLFSFLKRIRNVVGGDELSFSFRSPSDVELESFKHQTAQNLIAAKGWPIHRPDLDVEGIVEKTMALAHTLEVADHVGVR